MREILSQSDDDALCCLFSAFFPPRFSKFSSAAFFSLSQSFGLLLRYQTSNRGEESARRYSRFKVTDAKRGMGKRELITFSRITNLLHQQLGAANKCMINVIMDFMPFSRSFLCFHGRLAREENLFHLTELYANSRKREGRSWWWLAFSSFLMDSKTPSKGFNLLPDIKKIFSIKFFVWKWNGWRGSQIFCYKLVT